MLKDIFRLLSKNLSLLCFHSKKIDKRKNDKVTNYLKEILKKKLYKNARLKTHSNLAKEIIKLINKNLLQNFLNNQVIQKIFFIHNRYFIKKELDELLNDRKVLFWKRLISENEVGKPIRFFLYCKSSGNRIRQVYFIKKLIENTNINFENIDNVIELGGGYGCMAQIIKKIKPKINYLIYDMSEVNLLQYYYLKMNNLNPSLFENKGNLVLTNRISLLKKIIKKNHKTLLIANWSFSEFPINLRKKILPIINNSDFSIFSFQHKFENINNYQYFNKEIKKLKSRFEIKIKPYYFYNQSLFNKTKHYYLTLKKYDQK